MCALSTSDERAELHVTEEFPSGVIRTPRVKRAPVVQTLMYATGMQLLRLLMYHVVYDPPSRAVQDSLVPSAASAGHHAAALLASRRASS